MVLSLAITRAEAAIEQRSYEEALGYLETIRPSPEEHPDLALRALLAESWALVCLGKLLRAFEVLEEARSLAEQPRFSDLARAEVLFRLGCSRFETTSIEAATSLLTLALDLCDRPGLPADRLCAHILEWRSRCFQHQRNWDAAHDDIEAALQLVQGIEDRQTIADVYSQASLVAEREGQLYMAEYYAQEARSIYASLGDRLSLSRILQRIEEVRSLAAQKRVQRRSLARSAAGSRLRSRKLPSAGRGRKRPARRSGPGPAAPASS